MPTSLEKSHSKSSNAKLTLLCIASIICFSAFWVGVGMYLAYTGALWLIVGIAGAILTALCLLGFNAFKR